MNAVLASRAVCRASMARPLVQSAALSCAGLRQFHSTSVARKAAAAGALHKESSHWKTERVVSVACLGLIPAAMVAGPCMPIDMAMGVLFPLHGYWGVEQVITDYIHGGTKTAASAANALFAAGTVGALTYFNYNDVGITKAVQDLWAL